MKQQSAIQQKIKLIKNQNYFCDERSHPSQTQISQNDITNNIYYKLDQMKQDDLLNRERSISDYIKPVNNSRISNIHKQIYQFSNSHAKHNQNLVENHYFTQGIGKQNSVSGQKLINNSQNNTKYSQNNFLSSFSQEGYYSDSQKLTPRMNFYLQSRIQQNDVKITQDSNLQYNQSSSSYGISPRHYFNYKLLLQSNKISPIQLISKIASNSTVQECGINSKSKELGDNFENLQKQKNNDDEKGSKQIESIIYDEELDSQNKQLKDSSFFINSHTASDLILEDMTPGQFKISDAPSFLDQKHEALLNISNSNNYDYPLIDNLQNDSFYLNQNYQQLTDSELILKNPNEFFQKIGIKPLQVNKNKKKPLNQFLTEHVEKELGMMKKFDQGQIKDQKLNQSHFNNFVQQSKQLIQEDQQQSYQDIILEKKQVEKLRFDSPKCSQKNMNMIMLKNKYNVVKERIKIEKKDLTTSYLYENREQLKLEYKDVEQLQKKKKKSLRDIIFNNKERNIFKSVDHFKKTLKLKKMLQFQDIIQQTFSNHKNSKVQINQNDGQAKQIQKTTNQQAQSLIALDQAEELQNEKQQDKTEGKEKQLQQQYDHTKNNQISINKIQQLSQSNNLNLQKQFSLNQHGILKEPQTQSLNSKSSEKIDKIQSSPRIQNNSSKQNETKLKFWRVFSSKQLLHEHDQISSMPLTQRSQTPKTKFQNYADQVNKKVKWPSNNILNLKKSNKNQVNKKNRIYSASPDLNQKITSFSYQKPQKQIQFSKVTTVSDRPFSSYVKTKNNEKLVNQSNTSSIQNQKNIKTQNFKFLDESSKEPEKNTQCKSNQNINAISKLQQLQKQNRRNVQNLIKKQDFNKKHFINNYTSDNTNQFQDINSQSSHLQNEQESQMLNNSFVLSKKFVKNELNTVEKNLQNQKLQIENIQQKKGEYLSPFREKPSNQFIYDHMQILILQKKFSQLQNKKGSIKSTSSS